MDAFLFPKLLARKEIDCFQNPIIVIAASDIVDLLRKNGYADPEIVDDWLALGMETPSRLVSECWVFSDEAHTQKLVPSNPPEDETFTHTWLIREIASRFGWGAV